MSHSPWVRHRSTVRACMLFLHGGYAPGVVLHEGATGRLGPLPGWLQWEKTSALGFRREVGVGLLGRMGVAGEEGGPVARGGSGKAGWSFQNSIYRTSGHTAND